MTAKTTGDAVLTDARIESQHTPRPTTQCKDTTTFVERMLELSCPAFSPETVELRFSPKHKSGSFRDGRSTWHGSARHSSRIQCSQLPFDNSVPNKASQRTKLRFQSQLWHSCEVRSPPKPLTRHSTGRHTVAMQSLQPTHSARFKSIV